MRAVVYEGTQKVATKEVEDARIEKPIVAREQEEVSSRGS